MDFELSDEHRLIQRTVRDFATQEGAPAAEELDREKRFPYEIVAKLAELGLMGIPFPERYGGGGGDSLAYALAVEELTRVDSSVAITLRAGGGGVDPGGFLGGDPPLPPPLARHAADLPVRRRGAEGGVAAAPLRR